MTFTTPRRHDVQHPSGVEGRILGVMRGQGDVGILRDFFPVLLPQAGLFGLGGEGRPGLDGEGEGVIPHRTSTLCR